MTVHLVRIRGVAATARAGAIACVLVYLGCRSGVACGRDRGQASFAV